MTYLVAALTHHLRRPHQIVQSRFSPWREWGSCCVQARAAEDKMAKIVTTLMMLVLVAGCARVAESRVNPFNWFGGGRDARPVQTDTGSVNPLIPRERESIFRNNTPETYQGTLLQEVGELRIEPVQGGIVVRVEGVAPQLGAHDIRLIAVEGAEESATRLVFELRGLQDEEARLVGTQAITAAIALTDQAIAGVTTIEVVSASNRQSARL